MCIRDRVKDAHLAHIFRVDLKNELFAYEINQAALDLAELVEKEKAELAILNAFLPAAATDEEIRAEVDKAATALGAPTAKDMGAVMKAAMAALKETGKIIDGKKVSEAVKARLA